jgi:hypothetical protein
MLRFFLVAQCALRYFCNTLARCSTKCAKDGELLHLLILLAEASHGALLVLISVFAVFSIV